MFGQAHPAERRSPPNRMRRKRKRIRMPLKFLAQVPPIASQEPAMPTKI
jgi:hypothetical protein